MGFLIFVTGLLMLSGEGLGAYVSNVTPSCGSFGGETRLTIYGGGFSGDQFSRNNDPNKGNRVYLVSATGREYSCKVHKDGSTKSQVMCYTPSRMQEEDHYVKVVVDGTTIPEADLCAGVPTSADCTFKPQLACTPTIDSFSPNSGTPGTFVEMRGTIFSDRRGSNNVTASNNRTEQILRVYVGPNEAELQAPGTDTFYGLALDNSTTDYGTIKGRSISQSVGSFNASVIIGGQFGRSKSNEQHVSYNDAIYMYQQYTNIAGISSNTGSQEGGLLLRVDGPYIDNNAPYKPLKVLVGDEVCQVKDDLVVSNVSVTCEVPSDPSYTATQFPGNRGVNFEIWRETTKTVDTIDSILSLTSTSPGYQQTTLDETYFNDVGDTMDNYVSLMTSYYSPPHDGEYQFQVCGDGGARLYINGQAEATSIDNECAPSVRKTYNKNNRYLLQVAHYAATGSSSVLLKVKYFDTKFTSAWTNKAIQEKHNITVTAAVKYDVMNIAFQQFANQTFTQQVQTIAIDVPDSGEFRFCLHRACTEPVSTQMTESQISIAIAALPVFGSGEAVIVERQSTPTPTYQITIDSKRGDFELFTVQAKSGSSPLTFTAARTTPGVPDNDMVALTYNGTISTPFSVAALNQDTLQTAVDSLFEAKCPTVFSSPVNNVAKFFNSFEEYTANSWGKRVKETEPFSGRFVLESPGNMYQKQSTESGISLSLYGTLCFAYKGPLQSYVRATFSYKPTITADAETRSRNIVFNTASDTTSESWSYVCVDMLSKLQEIMSGGTEYRLHRLAISSLTEDTPGYVDAVFIGQKNTTNDPEVNELCMPPAMPHGVIIDEAIVGTVSASTYEVTLKPFECGYQLPLPILANGDVSSGSSSFPSSSVSSTLTGGSGAISVTRTLEASPPSTGFVDISYNGATKSNLNISQTMEFLEKDLESIDGIGDLHVWKEGDCANFDYTVTFQSSSGDLPEMTVSNVRVDPSWATVSINKVADGGLWYNPIKGDMLNTVHNKPQVRLYVNDIPVACSADCSFEWLNSATPSVTSISQETGTKALGTSIVINGAGFSLDKTKNSVSIGGVACSVTASTETSITCDVGNGPVGQHKVVVNVENKGNSSGNVYFTYIANIDSISPSSGGLGGGKTLTIDGYGFNSGAAVTINGVGCATTVVQPGQIECTLPPQATAGTYTVEVRQGTSPVLSYSSYTYSAAMSSTVSSVTPSKLPVTGGRLTITGSSFTATQGTVSLGAVPGVVDSWTDTQITVDFEAVPPGTHKLLVMAAYGHATDSSNNVPDYDVDFKITNVTPLKGSIIGGTKVTITGSSYGTDSTLISVKVGPVNCENPVVTNTQIVCQIGNAGRTYNVFSNGSTSDLAYGFFPAYSNINVGDSIQFSWAVPDHVNDISMGVYEVDGPTNTSLKSGGFSSGMPSKSGVFTKQFTAPGTYYIWSGFIDYYNTSSFGGSVHVNDAQSWTGEVDVKIGEYHAIHEVGGSADPADTSVCKTTTTRIASCQDNLPTGSDSSRFNFAFWTCSTPSVTSINVRNATANTNIVIKGDGFSAANCQNEINFGDITCNAVSSDEQSINCKFAQTGAPDLGTLHPLSVRVGNSGNALIKTMSVEGYSLQLIPSIHSITPTAGSTAGGASVTITGYGFGDSPLVSIGTSACEVIDNTYNMIICNSPQSDQTEREITVDAYVNNAPVAAKCETVSKTCRYTYSNLWTATMSSINPSSMSGSTAVTITGTNFGTNKDEVAVIIGGVDATVTDALDSSIIAQIANLPAGENNVVVKVKDYGKASGSLKVVSSLTITNVLPSSGSIHGGAVITIEGNGFVTNQTEVTLDGTQCEIDTVSLSAVTCKTGAHSAASVDITVISNGETTTYSSYSFSSASTPTISSISPPFGLPGETLTITGSNFDGGNVVVILDDADCTVTASTSTEIKCTLGDHSTSSVPVSLFVAGKGSSNLDKTFEYLLSLTSISPVEGSLGGGQTVTLTGAGFEDAAVVTICGKACTKIGTTSTEYTCRTPSNTAQSCEVRVSLNGLERNLVNAYTYSAALTPSVSGVSPRRGGTGGGVTVTISGSGFGTDASAISVMIDKAACAISTATDTQIVCVTGPHVGSVDTKVEVQISGNGIPSEATEGAADFSYIDVWSSIYTWGGGPIPQEGDFIVVPAGMTLLLDVPVTPILSFLLIQGGKLIFDEMDIELQAKSIMITDGGSLQVGTESNPFQHKAIITLFGHVLDAELPIYGTKVLALRNGTLDLHGIPVATTWTRLGSTADAGANTISLQLPVEWNVGDEIAIASTGHRHSQKENEKKTITSISNDKKVLTLNSPLEYKHWGTEETFGGRVVEYRAEVGLLTHNVVVRGNRDAQWDDEIKACDAGFDTGEFATQTCFQGRFGDEIGSSQFGGMILMHAPVKDQNLVVARLSYIEVTFAGQAFRLGRYPVHFHLNGIMTGSYVRGLAIHETFNRAVNIHGTHNVLVENTVIYNIMGGAFFLEDSIETGNTFQYNLAIFVISSTSLLNDDITPAAFWVTHPNNTIQHNAVAGGSHFGFWYRMLEHPDGPSFDPNICPIRAPFGVFRNNSAHSQGWFGLWIFPEYFPRDDPCNDSPVKWAVFDGLFTYNNEKGVEFVDTSGLKMKGLVAIQDEKAGYEAKRYKNLDGALYATPMLEDSLIVAKSSVIGDTTQGTTKGGIVLGYGAGFGAKNVQFYNFAESEGVAIRWTRIDGTCGHLCGSFNYKFEQMNFINSPNRARYEWEFEGYIRDIDGTATSSAGKAGYTIGAKTGSEPGDCEDAPEYSIGPIAARICPPNYKFHGFGFNEIDPHSLFGNNALITNEYGQSVCPFAEKRLRHGNGVVCALVSKTTNTLTFENTGPFVTSNVSFNGLFEDFEAGDYVYMQIAVPEMPDRFSIDGGLTYINASDTIDPIADKSGTWIWDNDNKLVKFVVNSNKRSDYGWGIYSVDQKVDLRLFKCAFPNCESPQDPNTVPPATERPADFDVWDTTTLWNQSSEVGFVSNIGGGYGVPQNYDNVKIENGTWVVVNITTTFNKLGTLIIEGVLEFIDTPGADYVIEADFIIIRCGRLLIGWPDDPFDALARIVLRGSQSSALVNAGEGPKLGTKAIGAFGGLDLFGKDKGITWTQLAAKAAAGANVITVADQVQWTAGDEIVIGPTSFNPAETEAFKLLSVDSDGVTLTLNSTLAYLHTAHSETVNGKTINVGAAVGLLTHNIKIVGEEYANMYTNSYGARVLVGTIVNNDQTCTGYARISNVEFRNTGQEGFTSDYDPRFSLAYLNTGPVNEVKPSLLNKNSFHNGFSTAIGAFGADGLNITGNVVYGTVGHGMKISSADNLLDGNLVVQMIHTATYKDRYEGYNYEAEAGIEAANAVRMAMTGNLVSGSEGMGFHVRPLDCAEDTSSRTNNMAYANFIGGVVNLPQDDLSGMSCVRVSGFKVWKSFDYGIYYQNEPSLIVSDVELIDNRAGVFPIVIKPDAINHEYADKSIRVENSIIVGQTDSWECAIDVAPTNDDNLRRTDKARYKKMLPFAGSTGLTLGNFYIKDNGLPTHPWAGCMAYPAIGGKTIVQDVTFVKFTNNACKKDYAITTSIDNDDGIHPSELAGITLINVDTGNKLFYHRPRAVKINSADCVDMDCDGHKKCLIKDTDGSFLGHIGDVIPQSEFGWDTDPVRGLGDYRIPNEMVTTADGNRIEYNDLCPNKGIISNKNCTYRSQWQAYECTSELNYEMLIIESMDADTETRRLSPLALVGQGYCDLINGPQDHGWCNGYTCRKRLSTFMALVATGVSYDMHFTSVSPKNMRLRLLNVAADEGIKFTTWYSAPYRLDVYANEKFIPAKNAHYDADGRYITTIPEGDEFEPSLNEPTGSNFNDKNSGHLTIIIMGPTVIDIKTQTSIIVSLTLPSLTEAQFFGEAIANNIANFLGIPAEKVRFVNVISASGGSRRKRSTDEEVIAEFEISDEPTEDLNGTSPNSLDDETLLNLGSEVVNECQVGNASATFNISGGCNSVELPSSDLTTIMYSTPSPNHLFFHQEPEPMHEGVKLQKQPHIRAADLANVVVTELGTNEYPWQLTASLRPGTGHPNAQLTGNLTVTSVNGWFNFSDLTISHMGSDYIIDFQATYPTQAENFTLASAPIQVAGRPVKLHVADQTTGDIVLDTRFSVVLDLLDLYTEDIISDIGWRDHTWTAEAKLIDSSDFATLDGTLTSTFDMVSGQVMFPDLTLTGFGMYYVQFRVMSDPADYELTLNHKLNIKRPDHVDMIIENENELQVKFGDDFRSVLPDIDHENSLEQMVLTSFANWRPDVYFSGGSIREGSIIVTFTIAGTTTLVNDTVFSICGSIYNDTSFSFNGHTLTLSPFLTVNGQTYYGVACGDMSDDDEDEIPVYLIVIAVVVPIIVLVMLIIVVWRFLIKPKEQRNVPMFVKPLNGPGNTKFGHPGQTANYIGSATMVEDKEFLFRDNSFTSLRGKASVSPLPPMSTTLGDPYSSQNNYYRGSPSPISPPPMKTSLNQAKWISPYGSTHNGSTQNGGFTGQQANVGQGLHVPVSPLPNQQEQPRQPSPSGRASPMIHQGIALEREDSMPPVGEDSFFEKL